MNISRCNLIFYFILGKPTVNGGLDVIWFFYFILGKPTVNVGPDKSVNLGNSVTLQCVVIATPSATSVQWNKITNGVSNRINVAANPTKYAGASTNTPSLTIYTAANSDQSSYTCQATNAAGTTVSSQTFLTVVGSKYIYYSFLFQIIIIIIWGTLWFWLYGSWISNYLYNQCLSPLSLWFQIPPRWGVLNSWFSLVTLVFFTNKTDPAIYLFNSRYHG